MIIYSRHNFLLSIYLLNGRKLTYFYQFYLHIRQKYNNYVKLLTMITLRQIIQDELTSKPLVEAFLQEGLVNVSALAAYLHSRVEQVKGEKVSIEAIAMTVRRLQKVQARNSRMSLPIAKTIQIQSDISILTFSNTTTVDYASLTDSRFICHTRGIKETMLAISKEDATVLRDEATRIQDGMSALIITLDNETPDSIGAYAQVQLLLALSGVPIAEVSSIHDDLIVIIEATWAEAAFSALRRLSS